MIPLGNGDIPANGNEAAQRIGASIAEIMQSTGTRPAITCDIASPGVISQLTIDLSNVESAAAKARRPSALTKLGDTLLQGFRVIGQPVILYGAPVRVEVKGSNIPASWSRDDHGDLWLVPSGHESETAVNPATGFMELSSRAAAVEAAMRAAVSQIADANGARLKDLRLRLESTGPRGILVAVDVAAAKFMMTARVRALAEASLDDEMNLRVGNVEITGDGAAGSMVANFLAGKASQWRGREIPLAQYMFAGAALRDVEMTVGEELRLRARFGQ